MNTDRDSIKEALKETNVSTSLIKASTLLKLMDRRIECPNKFTLDNLKELFINPGIITDQQIDKFLK